MTNSDQLARVDETQVTSGQKTSRIGETWSSSLFPHSVDPRRFCVPDKASTRYWKLSLDRDCIPWGFPEFTTDYAQTRNQPKLC